METAFYQVLAQKNDPSASLSDSETVISPGQRRTRRCERRANTGDMPDFMSPPDQVRHGRRAGRRAAPGARPARRPSVTNRLEDSRLANSGAPEPTPGADDLNEAPPRPFPGERPLGSDEPSEPYEETPPNESPGPGIGPERPAAEPTAP